MAWVGVLERGLLTIGKVSTAKYFVPHLLARFHEDHPGIDVRLRVLGNREQLVAQMHTGEVALTIMGLPPREIATRAEAFAPHPLVFVAPPRPPVAGHAAGAGDSAGALQPHRARARLGHALGDGGLLRRTPRTSSTSARRR